MANTCSEEAFEAYIEQQLVGLHSYNKDNPADFDRQAVINTAGLWAFLEEPPRTSCILRCPGNR